MSKHFKNVTSYENLKEQFKILLKANHPDNGGNEDIMKEINCEYDALFPIWKDRKEVETGDTVQETASSTRSKFYTECGWEGKNHDWNRSLKEIAQIVRSYVKEKYPTHKFSVRTSYASMCQELHVSLKEAPEDIYKQSIEELTEDEKSKLLRKLRYNNLFEKDSWYEWELDEAIESAWLKSDHYKAYNDVTFAMLNDVDAFVESYNFDDCDGMIDYFHVDFYYFGCSAKDVKIVPKTARIKNKTSKPSKANKAAPKAENPSIEQKSGYTYKISKGEDTRDGSELWVVRIVESLEREAYKAEADTMKELGAYYSRYLKGFLFRHDPTTELIRA